MVDKSKKQTGATQRKLSPRNAAQTAEVEDTNALRDEDLENAKEVPAELITQVSALIKPETIETDIVISSDEEKGFFSLDERPAGYYKPDPKIPALQGIIVTRQLVISGDSQWFQYIVRATAPTIIWYWDGEFDDAGKRVMVSRTCKPLELVGLSESYQLYAYVQLLAQEGRTYEIRVKGLNKTKATGPRSVWQWEKKAREVELRILNGKMHIFPVSTRAAQPADLSPPPNRAPRALPGRST